ncbi:ABC transporter substrate-binding protein [Tistrella mobilis]|uniref:Extracellular solute-binding protein family 5 n=1 Tax=Tistrella mobilis (strain KA081020-065) TaxID=1110502 RepID=I3TRZ6_TISMK|nr:ABC transporter substrate-binding protein [Tistrella mobilis]AFK55534.1 extracellular solute-binding protein family 5 [Tistrella mobilis KA081020-065]
MDRRDFLKTGGLAGLFLSVGGVSLPIGRAFAREGDDITLRVLAEDGPNSRDPHGDGVNRAALGTFTNIYDRLVNFDRIEVAPGLYRYDYLKFKGELAESWEVLEDGRVLVFHLRPDATFHDGRPVTAEDVRWSLERGINLPASKRQLSTGSITSADQFEVVDAHTFRMRFEKADRYTMPNLALTFASVINAEAVKANATAEDPWGKEWLRNNAAGGGAYKVANWTAGQQVIYDRFDDWKSGDLPRIRRAVVQVVPAAPARVAAVTKGDADVALQLPPKDVAAIDADPKVDLISLPVTNSFRFVAFNTQTAPFDDVRVRQAIAFALPYDAMFQGSIFGRGTPLYGAASDQPETSSFPQPYPYATDLDRARALLAEAGHEGGFETSFSYNVADAITADPIALLVQEQLGRIGIKVVIEKVPAAQWGTLLTEKKVPFYVEGSSAWFNDPDYFFRIFFQGDWRWNFGAFKNEELGALVEKARWETDKDAYDELMRQAIRIVFRELPIMPLWLPSFDAALKPGVTDFTYYIHGQVDFRPLDRKA